MLDMRSGGGAAQAEQKPSLVEGAYDALKEAIRNNVFAPGYQGSEQEIASRLGMSRTPVHEAVIRLQEEGLVRVLPDRKSTRLNSSHANISYAVFCLKKKNKTIVLTYVHF